MSPANASPRHSNRAEFLSLPIDLCFSFLTPLYKYKPSTHTHTRSGKEKSFGNPQSLTYIPGMTLWKRDPFASLIIFCFFGGISIFTTIYSTFRLSLRSITITAFFSVLSGYSAGAAFGYTGRIIHAGFHTDEQSWGPPFGAKGPVSCSYNNDVKAACEGTTSTISPPLPV